MDSFNLSITADNMAEGDEDITFTLDGTSIVTLSATPASWTVGTPNSATFTIRANDGHADQRAVHLLTITGPATLNETDSDAMSGNYTVTRTGDEFTESTTVNIAVTHTTTSAADISVPASVTFAAGDDTETFQVTVRGDALNEAAEMFSLRTAGGSGLTHAAAIAVTLNDNDDITSVTVADAAAVSEGDSTDFTVTLDHASAGVVTVAWTANIGGTMGGTPQPASGSLQIPAGMTTADITIGIPHNTDLGNGDTRMLTVTLGTVTIAAPGRGTVTTTDTATATVNYITAAHTISIADATVDEGAAEIAITRTGPALTSSATITWTATAGTATAADFTGGVLPSGTVTFAGDSTRETITVAIADDALSEGAEDFSIALRADAAVLASNMQIALGAAATITITDNDAISAASMTLRGPAMLNEERSAQYTVDLGAEVTGSAVTVAITTGGTATLNTDYTLSATSVTIAIGSRSGTFTVTATDGGGDDTPDRMLELTLTATGGANTAAMAAISHTITITEDDPAARTLTVTGPATHAETDADSTVQYRVALGDGDTAFTAATTVTWTVTPGTASADDFAALTGTIEFPAASTFAVTVIGDNLSEGDETFSVQVSVADASADGGTGYGAAAATTITDDDAIGGMSMTLRGPLTLNEERSAQYTVDLGAEVTGSDVTVAIVDTCAACTPMADDHYTLSPASVTIAPGARSGVFTVATTDGGGIDTPDRTLTLTLTATGGANTAAMAAISRTIAITEDDPAAREARLEAPLASAGRGVGMLAAAAVQQRLAASTGGSGGGNSLTIAGRDLANGAGGGVEVLAAEVLASGYATGDADLSTAELLRRGVGFALAGGDGGRGFSFWGSGGFVSADGKHDGVDYDGDTSAFTLGIDTGWRDGLIGVAVSRSSGDTDFTVTADGMESTLETEVTSVHPYLTRRFNRSQLWLTAGQGSGDAELVESDATIKTDITVTTAAFGITHARGDLFTAGLSALYSRAKLDEATGNGKTLPATTADSLRITASGEAGWSHGPWRPFLTFTLRHDSGDGDTGGAADLGGGVEFRTPTVHVRLAGSGHIQGQAADEQRATLIVRKSTGNFDLSLNFAADDAGIDTARLLTGEWRF